MKSTIVRTAQADDAGSIRAIQNIRVSEIAQAIDSLGTSNTEVRDQIETTLRDYPFLVACEGDETIGFAYARAHRAVGEYRWSVDVVLQVTAQCSGETTQRLYQSLLHEIRAQGYLTAYALVHPQAEYSIALHQTLGFSRLGAHAAIDLLQDSDCWCLALCESNPRSEPISFAHLCTQRQRHIESC